MNPAHYTPLLSMPMAHELACLGVWFLLILFAIPFSHFPERNHANFRIVFHPAATSKPNIFWLTLVPFSINTFIFSVFTERNTIFRFFGVANSLRKKGLTNCLVFIFSKFLKVCTLDPRDFFFGVRRLQCELLMILIVMLGLYPWILVFSIVDFSKF